ncbi:MAG: PAS domain S-box protein [Desulfobacter sp.]|nr:PAS domain S-box protein [Desulfobacter sp.]
MTAQATKHFPSGKNGMTVNTLKEGLPQLWPMILDVSPDGMILINDAGEILYSNMAAKAIFGRGVTQQNLLGLHFADIRPDAWPDL